MIRYYSGTDPDVLSDEEWAKLYNEIIYVKQVEQKSIKQTIRSALIEVLNEAFKK